MPYDIVLTRAPVSDVLLTAAYEGLGACPKTFPSKYLYDGDGSRLFDAICGLAEYHVTRTETALLQRLAPALSGHVPAGAAFIEFGSGASLKTRILLDAAPQIGVYVPIDISPSALAEATAELRQAYPGLDVSPLVGDFTEPLDLPQNLAARARVGFFPGSTIGNFTPPEAVAFLETVQTLLGPGGRLILGADLIPVPKSSDSSGVFNGSK